MKPGASGQTCTLEVLRFHPEHDTEPHVQSYEVPYREDWVVLDALNFIKNEVDGTLTYRWSCRMGVCGSCGMRVNDYERLTCAAFLKEYQGRPIRVSPLVNFPVIRDLVVDFTDFLEKLAAAKSWLIPKDPPPADREVYLQTPNEVERFKQYSMCINCMLCYSACPVYGLEPEYIGPAVIALAQRYNYDSRDGGQDERLNVLSTKEGIWECTLIGECSVVCPTHVDPAGAIQRAKLTSAQEWWRTVLMPWTNR